MLAGIGTVESDNGRNDGPSSAGALGPMQFLPSTWQVYGDGGNIMSPADAIPAAARLLLASGAPGRMWQAIFAYNHPSALGGGHPARPDNRRSDRLEAVDSHLAAINGTDTPDAWNTRMLDHVAHAQASRGVCCCSHR